MANVDNPNGLTPVGHQLGLNWSGAHRPYYVSSSSAIYVGDPMVITGTANTSVIAAGAENYLAGELAAVDRHTAGAGSGSVCTGVMVGKRPDPTDLSKIYIPANTASVVYVLDDPHVIYRIKEDSAGGALAATSVGLNADIALDVAGNTTTGLSGAELDSSTAATSASRTLKILGKSFIIEANGAANDIGADCKWNVIINQHTHNNGVAGV